MYWNTTAPRDSFYYVNQWGPAYEADRAIEYIEAQKANDHPFAFSSFHDPPHTGYDWFLTTTKPYIRIWM